MHVAMVSEHASPLAALGGVDAGGQNVHVAALAGELARSGHQVRVYTRRDDPDLPERVPCPAGFEVVHVPAGPAAPIGKDRLLPFMRTFGEWLSAEWSRAGPPDVVHAHFWMSGLAAVAASRRHHVPVVLTYHALGSLKRRHQGDADTSPVGRVQLETDLGRAVDLIIATCTDEVRELARMGITPDPVTVVPCGVDTTLFAPRVARGATRSRRHPRLLSLGRLVERKGVDTVIEALADVPDAELLVAGGPPLARLDGDPEARRLRAMAHRLGVDDRVRFLGGQSHASTADLICSADVVVCTPWYEPFGIVPLEAAACGRPVVGSAVGGLLDTIVDGRTGLLVPPHDPAALAAALRPLLADGSRRERMGRAARRRAAERYSWGAVAERTATAYRSVVSRAPALREVSGI